MRAYREKDYDEMAGRVVDRFLRGEVKLADAAVEEATQGQLNPDQIERLVQAANTQAFLRMMEQRQSQGQPDATHEFDPVDTATVLQSIIGQSPMGQPSPMGHDMDLMSGHGGMPPGGDELPDEMSAHRAPPHAEPDGDEGAPPIDDGNDGPFPKGEKQKAKDDSSKKDNDKPKKEPAKEPAKDEKKEASVRFRRMRKLAELLDDQYLQAELAFEEGYAKLARQFKLAHNAVSFEAFEKDAMSLDDIEHGTVVLNLLREDRGMQPLDVSATREKHASLADRHLVADSEAIRLFEHLVRIASEASRVKRGAEHARALCS